MRKQWWPVLVLAGLALGDLVILLLGALGLLKEAFAQLENFGPAAGRLVGLLKSPIVLLVLSLSAIALALNARRHDRELKRRTAAAPDSIESKSETSKDLPVQRESDDPHAANRHRESAARIAAAVSGDPVAEPPEAPETVTGRYLIDTRRALVAAGRSEALLDRDEQLFIGSRLKPSPITIEHIQAFVRNEAIVHGTQRDGVPFILHFSDASVALTVQALGIGSTISAKGTISRITNDYVGLNDCQLRPASEVEGR
jgi:hypothetical protein